MNACESECLQQDDVRLFHKGACHILAVALKELLPDEAYVLKRVLLQKEFDTKVAYHVFAAKGEFVVDASGIKRADDYLVWLRARHQEKIFGGILIPLVELHDVSETDLLAEYHDDAHLGSVNRWGLFSGPEFVSAARARAVAFVEHWPEKFRVSILEAGRLLKKR